MVQIHQKILSSSARNVPGRSMNPKYITVHNTANASKGADAEMHARYLLNGAGGRSASWHYTVDDKEIYQHLRDDHQGWHAGDGGGSGNTQSIGIEICENSDGDFEKAVENAQWLIKKLMNKHNIGIGNVVTHKHWSGKNCPRLLLDQWSDFKKGIGTDKKTVSAPKTQVKTHTTSKTSSLIRKGDKGPMVTRLQKDLLAAGEKLPRFGADGHFGDETKDAVKSLQRKAGIAVDGIVGPNTRDAIEKRKNKPKRAIVPYPGVLIKKGSRGKNVERIQRTVGSTPDGIYGKNTKAAVKAYQRRHGLSVDGIVGPDTWAVMF